MLVTAIIGGGLCGLALARSLARQGTFRGGVRGATAGSAVES